jgi:pSer/pThr/pTyr-binding forkhead associated (FHA) protein
MEAKLIVVGGKASKSAIALKLPTIIGRSREAGLTIAHPMISRQHCELFEVDGLLMIRDMGSLNGTVVAGQQIKNSPLPPNTEFTVGPLTFRADYTYEGDLSQLPAAELVEKSGAAPAAEAETPDFEAIDEPTPVAQQTTGAAEDKSKPDFQFLDDFDPVAAAAADLKTGKEDAKEPTPPETVPLESAKVDAEPESEQLVDFQPVPDETEEEKETTPVEESPAAKEDAEETAAEPTAESEPVAEEAVEFQVMEEEAAETPAAEEPTEEQVEPDTESIETSSPAVPQKKKKGSWFAGLFGRGKKKPKPAKAAAKAKAKGKAAAAPAAQAAAVAPPAEPEPADELPAASAEEAPPADDATMFGEPEAEPEAAEKPTEEAAEEDFFDDFLKGLN